MRKLIFLTCIALGLGVVITIVTLLLLRDQNILPKNFKKFSELQHCRNFKRKERTNLNHLYFYENTSSDKNLIWCKVPKAGSTTLTNLFLRLAGVQLSNGTKVHKILRHYYPRLTEKLLKKHKGTSFTFLVVRDPFERILSAYRDKLESYERDLAFRNGYYFDNYGRFMVPQKNGTKTVPSWSQFVKYLIKTSPGRYDEHWMPIHKLCSPCSFSYNAIIKIENMDKELPMNLKKINIATTNIGWSHRTGSSHPKLIQKYYRNLTLIEVKQLYTIYKKDFQLFGYTPFKYYRMTRNKGGS